MSEFWELGPMRTWFSVVFTASVTLLVLGGVFSAMHGCKDDRCVDTVTLVSVVPGNPSSASCRPGMTMKTENRVQGVVVTCTCPK